MSVVRRIQIGENHKSAEVLNRPTDDILTLSGQTPGATFAGFATTPALAAEATARANADALLLGVYAVQPGEAGVTNTQYPVGIPERYGALANGVGDDTAAILAAGTAATALGYPLTFSPRKTYRSTGVSFSGSSLRIVGQGATLVQCANASPITLRGGYSDLVGVSAFLATTQDYAGDGSGTTPCTRLTVSTWPASVAVGSIVRVVSDDQLAGTRAAVGSLVARRGEYAVVGAIDAGNGNVYLRALLRDTYSTAPRLAVLKDVSYEIADVVYDVDAAGASAGWNSALVDVSAAHSCQFTNLRARASYGRFLKLCGLKGYTVTNMRAANLANDPSQTRYGYGIDDQSCEGGRVIAPIGRNCRHVFTTNINPVAAGSTEIESFGNSYGFRVIGGESIDSANCGFDSHLGALDGEFIACRDMQSRVGAVGVGGGFQIRGKRIVYRDCVTIGGKSSILIDNESITGATSGIELHNCKGLSPSAAGSVYVNVDAACDVLFNGGRYESPGKVLQIHTPGTVTLKGGVTFATIGNLHNYVVTQEGASTVTIDDAVLDISGMTAASPWGLVQTDAGAVCKGRRLSLVAGGVTPSRLFRGSGGTLGTVDVREIEWDAKPTTIAEFIATVRYSARTLGGGWSSDVQGVSVTADAQVPSILAELADDHLYLQLSSSAADGATWVLGALPSGYRTGQRLTIRNASSTNGHITLSGTAATSNIDQSADLELGNRDAVTLEWIASGSGGATDSYWRVIGLWRSGSQPALSGRLAIPDADTTVKPTENQYQIRSATTLTADRSLTLSVSKAVVGQPNYHVWRTATGAFNLLVKNGNGGATLKALAVNTWAEFMFDGTNYHLIAYGAL